MPPMQNLYKISTNGLKCGVLTVNKIKIWFLHLYLRGKDENDVTERTFHYKNEKYCLEPTKPIKQTN